jgi:hypothetical protein
MLRQWMVARFPAITRHREISAISEPALVSNRSIDASNELAAVTVIALLIGHPYATFTPLAN